MNNDDFINSENVGTDFASNKIDEDLHNSDTNSLKTDEEEEESTGCFFIKAILVILAIIVLVCFNPSKKDHRVEIQKTMEEVIQSRTRNGHSIKFGQIRDFEEFDYHSLYVCSWTTARIDGRKKLLTIGILGWTHAMF